MNTKPDGIGRYKYTVAFVKFQVIVGSSITDGTAAVDTQQNPKADIIGLEMDYLAPFSVYNDSVDFKILAATE